MYMGSSYVCRENVVGSSIVQGSENRKPGNLPFVNRKELRVIGLSRSGNHAIIDWILSQAQGRTCFLNCAEGQTNPFVSARSLASGFPFKTNYLEFNWEQEQAGVLSQKDLLVHSYEDSFLGYVCHPLFEQHHDQWVGKSLARYDVLILRDPFNLFASRKRAESVLKGVSPATAVRIWQQHAREFLGLGRYLNRPHILINYNRWATDRSYRQMLAARLELDFTDTSLNRVSATGGGSSFDGTHYDGHASAMRILERWKVYQNDPSYLQLLKPKLVEYTAQIFEPLPGVKQLLNTAG